MTKKQYPYVTDGGETIVLAPGYKTSTKETWEKREQLPPPPETIYIPPFTPEEIDFILDNLENL